MTTSVYVRLLVALVIFTNFYPLFGQTEKQDDLFFKDRLGPISDDNIFRTEGYYNWGASIIKAPDGKYHLFYSRWKRDFTFYGWLTHSEVAHAVANHPAGPWTYKETVLQGAGKGHWDAVTAHNPKIKYFEGKYYLYYIATNMGDRDYSPEYLKEISKVGYSHPDWKTLRVNQRTGVAVAESLNGPWERPDEPLIEPSGPITTLTVNPAISQGADGRYYLIVKGDKPNETRFIRNQAMAVADAPTGPFEMQDLAVIDDLDTEDVSMWYDAGREQFYGVFHAHGFIGMINSPDGLHWKKATEYSLMPKQVAQINGDTLRPDRLERPFVYTEDDAPTVLSLAVKKGDDSYTIFIPVEQHNRPRPNARQLAWQEAELGAIFHYDLHVFDGKQYGQANNRIDPIQNYQQFKPEKLDTDQWVKAIKEAGFTFALLTATHETGFALFQSEVNPYSMKALNFQNGQGDIVRDFVNSCRKYGIRPGIYLGIRWNSFFGVHNFQVQGEGTFREQRQQYYNLMVEGMLREICTNYGELFEIWFDGGADHPANGAPDVLPIVQRYQPNCLFYHNLQLAEARWGGSESGTVDYPCWATFPNPYSHGGETPAEHIRLLKQGDPNGDYWMPAMADAPLRGYNGRHEWFWEPGDEDHIYPLAKLMNMYEKSVGRNATLILGLTPDPDGLLPEPDVQRLQEWGQAIREKYGTPRASANGNGFEFEVTLDKMSLITHLILQEDITEGERVRAYEVEIRKGGRWQTIATGTAIGQKRIQVFDPVETKRIRLRITSAEDRPQIKAFSVFTE